MKTKQAALLLLSLFPLAFSQAPQNSIAAPIATTLPVQAAPVPVPPPPDPFVYRPLDQLVGQRFVFKPMMTARQKQTGYVGIDYDYNPDYHEYTGRTVKVIGIEGTRFFPRLRVAIEDNAKEYVIITQSGSMEPFIFVPDVDSAKARWLNATLWYKGDNLPCCHPEDADTVGTLKLKRFSPVKVLSISASWDVARPVRFTVQTPDGQQGFVDVNMSGTNVPRAFRGQNRFNDLFFSQDPRTLYSWSDSVWSHIENGDAAVGMTPEQAQLSLGAPKDSSSDGPGRCLWNYSSGSCLHFENGQIMSIDVPQSEDASSPEDAAAVAPPDFPKPDPQ